eukprot:jgi/Orpsp1_1/1182145/evm.model.c7180000080069.1
MNTIPVYIEAILYSLINDITTTYSPYNPVSTITIITEIIFTLINPSFGMVSIINTIFNIYYYYGKSTNIEVGFFSIFKFNSGFLLLIVTLVVAIIIYFNILLILDNMEQKSDNTKHINNLENEALKYNENTMKEADDDIYNEYINVKENFSNLPFSVLQLSKEYKVNIHLNKKEKKLINERKDHYYGDIRKSKFSKNSYVKTIIDDISFGVNNKECFGILGPNNSGKSTILNMISSYIPQTIGHIYYNGIDSHKIDLSKISVGYCPQKELFWKDLTVIENIKYFLKLHGYSKNEVDELSSQLIRNYCLEFDKDLTVNKLSYNTKRKLCLLIALCDQPKKIILDEPTLGMDPIMKRHIWNLLKNIKNNNRSTIMIVTTKSMEEAQYLCDRIGILINGKLVSIGSLEHIRNKYTNYYILEISSNQLDKFHQNIIEKENLLGHDYMIEEKLYNRIRYKVSIHQSIGKIFEIMERCKASGLVLNYSFGKISLDQFFLDL